MSSFTELCHFYWNRQVWSGFPRELTWPGDDKRREHCELRDYYPYITSKHKANENCFSAFYSDKERAEKKMCQLFVDLDRGGKKRDVAQLTWDEETWEVQRFFMMLFYPYMEPFYSGSKGFHAYIHMLPFNIDDLRAEKPRLRLVFSTWLQLESEDELDSTVFVNPSALCRIPMTKHPKTGRWKIPIDPSWSLEEIIERATNPEKYTESLYRLSQRKIRNLDWKIFLKNPKDIIAPPSPSSTNGASGTQSS